MCIEKEKVIRSIVETSVRSYATAFCDRHISEIDVPGGTLNMKIHNVFIAALGEEIQYYSALARSLDSSLGNMLESMAITIAKLFYEVSGYVEGELSREQTIFIAELLERYKNHDKKPESIDYLPLRDKPKNGLYVKRHESDYYLYDSESNVHHLIELKIGGDLDNKKARSEKEAILEQYAILSNSLNKEDKIDIHFATAYNRFGEGKTWKQERVRQFFSDEELLIGADFWNLICKSAHGYDIVIDEYKKQSYLIKKALDSIKEVYLNN